MEDILMITFWILMNHTQEAFVRLAVTGIATGVEYTWGY